MFDCIVQQFFGSFHIGFKKIHIQMTIEKRKKKSFCKYESNSAHYYSYYVKYTTTTTITSRKIIYLIFFEVVFGRKKLLKSISSSVITFKYFKIYSRQVYTHNWTKTFLFPRRMYYIPCLNHILWNNIINQLLLLQPWLNWEANWKTDRSR